MLRESDIREKKKKKRSERRQKEGKKTKRRRENPFVTRSNKTKKGKKKCLTSKAPDINTAVKNDVKIEVSRTPEIWNTEQKLQLPYTRLVVISAH